MPDVSKLWAKTLDDGGIYPLPAHLLDAACVAGVLYDEWLRQGLRDILSDQLGDNARENVMFAAGCHDLGKATPFFAYQPYSRDTSWNTIRDSLMEAGFEPFNEDSAFDITQGDIYTERELRRHERSTLLHFNPDADETTRVSDNWVAVAGLGHHGTFTYPGLDTWEYAEEPFEEGGWIAAQKILHGLILEGCGITKPVAAISPTAALLISGLTILADRVASHEDFVESGARLIEQGNLPWENPDEWISLRHAEAQAKVRSTVGIYQPWEDNPVAAILGDNTPTEVQEFASTPADLMSFMIPTGHGKTEAALLRHAQKSERLMFLLPTMATTNAMMSRVEKAFRSTGNLAALAHGMAGVEDFYVKSEKDANDLLPGEFAHHSAMLTAPITVGTVDQILKAALPDKWIHLRLLALANAHVVIDEVHTLDPYQTQLLVQLMRWLGATKTRVTLLSATLAAEHREELLSAYGAKDTGSAEFPAVDCVEDTRVVTQRFVTPEVPVEFELEESTQSEVVESHSRWVESIFEVHPQARVGVICNTVKRAQDTARAISQIPGVTVILLHSRMTQAHRKLVTDALESAIGKGGSGTRVCVVGTQVIEASLDIDVDFLRTELCPAASLVQRMGRAHRRKDDQRMHRAGEFSSKPISVVRFHEGKSALPYMDTELDRTWKWLTDNSATTFPLTSQDFIDTSAFSLAAALENPEGEELGMYLAKLNTGKAKAAPIDRIMSPALTLQDLETLSSRPQEGIRTRLVDIATQRVIVCAKPGSGIPGAWEGDPADFVYPDRDKVRAMLAGSITLPVTHVSKLTTIPFESERAALRGYSLVELDSSVYSSEFGFMLKE